MIIIKTLKQTCFACPSQWEGTDIYGNEIYIRYRWGHLSISVNHAEIVSHQLGEGLAGGLTTEELKVITRNIFKWD